MDLTNKVTSNVALKAAGITVSGTPAVRLTFTSAHGEKLSVMATGDTSNVLGLGTFLAGSGQCGRLRHPRRRARPTTIHPRGAPTSLEFSLNGAASSGDEFRQSVNLDGGDATGATRDGHGGFGSTR